MHQRPFLGSGWARGGASEVVRRACPASGADWNVQVVRGKVNGKCLWNACKALSLGLLLMVLGAAMATIGYYADHLSIAQEVRGNHTVKIKNESRGFHLNNLSYAGPIVMGVGGFIVVAACVMTFEARDSAAKVVPARFKLSTNGGGSSFNHHRPSSGHGPYVTSTTAAFQAASAGVAPSSTSYHHYPTSACNRHERIRTTSRRALTESFMNFSKSLSVRSQRSNLKKVSQSLTKSPSAPNLLTERSISLTGSQDQAGSPSDINNPNNIMSSINNREKSGKNRTFANCALLNAGLLHRHALSVDESTANYRLSRESLQGNNGGSQGSLALDLHLDYPVTLRIHDRRRNPLIRQRRVLADEDEQRHHHQQHHGNASPSRRSSYTCSGRMPNQCNADFKIGHGGSAHHIPRRSSNASSDSRTGYRSSSSRRLAPSSADYHHYHHREKLERALSYDARLLSSNTPRKNRRHYCSSSNKDFDDKEAGGRGGSCSDTDIRHVYPVVHFSNYQQQ